MMFMISKIAGFLIDPYNLMVLSGLILAFVHRQGAVFTLLRRAAAAWLLFIASLFFIPWGGWLLTPLETRTITRDLGPGEEIAGTIVLGGAANGRVSRARDNLELSEHGDRVLALIEALRADTGPVIYTGEFETEFAAQRLKNLVDEDELGRLVIEPDALTTAEHPARIADLGLDLTQPDQTYALVTSAFHMPRSAAVFRKAGVKVHPVPTDYLAYGRTRLGWSPRLKHQLELLRIAMKEYVGLVGYKLANRI